MRQSSTHSAPIDEVDLERVVTRRVRPVLPLARLTGEAHDVMVRFAWTEVCSVVLDETDAPNAPRLARTGGVYRLRFVVWEVGAHRPLAGRRCHAAESAQA